MMLATINQLPLFTSIDPLVFLKDYIGPNGYWTFRPPLWEKGFRDVAFARLLGNMETSPE